MNFYPHHIGDFNNATRHLTRIERSIYRDMIELYYDTEFPLTLDRKALCRKLIARTDEEAAAVEQVLNEFFTETAQGWHHSRCEEEIAEYRTSISAKSAAGKASAAKRESDRLKRLEELNSRSTAVQQPLDSVDSSVQLTSNQEPVTSNQEPVTPKQEPTNIEEAKPRGVKAVDLSIAMRDGGVRSQPADPRLIALAKQGVTPETVAAACAAAKISKPDEEVSVGYVTAIIERWAKEAAAMKASGATIPQARASPGYAARDASRAAAAASIGLGGHHGNESRIIDIQCAVIPD